MGRDEVEKLVGSVECQKLVKKDEGEDTAGTIEGEELKTNAVEESDDDRVGEGEVTAFEDDDNDVAVTTVLGITEDGDTVVAFSDSVEVELTSISVGVDVVAVSTEDETIWSLCEEIENGEVGKLEVGVADEGVFVGTRKIENADHHFKARTYGPGHKQ